MTTRRLIEIGLAMAVLLLVVGCIIWPVVPYIAAWWALFDAWKFTSDMRGWHFLFG
jgi:hypothetical protein